MDKLYSDLYFMDKESLLNNYKLNELKGFCKKNNILVSGNKTNLVNRMKEHLERCRQYIAYRIVYSHVHNLLNSVKSLKEFNEKVNDIDDKLLRDCYSECGEEYDREKMIKRTISEFGSCVHYMDKYWCGEDIVVNKGELILEHGGYLVIRNGMFYRISISDASSFNYPYRLVEDKVSDKLEEYEPFYIHRANCEIKTKVIEIDDKPKKAILANVFTGEANECFINPKLEITKRALG